MQFNDHFALEGQHAFLSASKHHWTNYDLEKLDRTFLSAIAAKRGTELHDLAHNLIRLKVKLPNNKKTLNQYVNDALGYRMTPEQVLYYSENCFGTADAISFRNNTLRISDLKTGVTHTSERQLEVYSAMFCLEYGFKPHEIAIELRIYQNDECRIYEADPEVILQIMDTIVTFDKHLKKRQKEVLL